MVWCGVLEGCAHCLGASPPTRLTLLGAPRYLVDGLQVPRLRNCTSVALLVCSGTLPLSGPPIPAPDTKCGTGLSLGTVPSPKGHWNLDYTSMRSDRKCSLSVISLLLGNKLPQITPYRCKAASICCLKAPEVRSRAGCLRQVARE